MNFGLNRQLWFNIESFPFQNKCYEQVPGLNTKKWEWDWFATKLCSLSKKFKWSCTVQCELVVNFSFEYKSEIFRMKIGLAMLCVLQSHGRMDLVDSRIRKPDSAVLHISSLTQKYKYLSCPKPKPKPKPKSEITFRGWWINKMLKS